MLDPKSPVNGFKRFFNTPGNTNCISHNLIWYLTQSASDSNLIWIGTAIGLTKLRTNTETFISN